LGRGARRRALDRVRSPLVDAGSAGQSAVAGCRQRSAFSSGSSVLCSARSAAPARRRGTPLRGAVWLPAHPMVLRVHDLIEVLRPDPYRTDGLPFSERSDAMLLASFQASSTWRS